MRVSCAQNKNLELGVGRGSLLYLLHFINRHPTYHCDSKCHSSPLGDRNGKHGHFGDKIMVMMTRGKHARSEITDDEDYNELVLVHL